MAAKKAPAKKMAPAKKPPAPTPPAPKDWEVEFDKWANRMRREGAIKRSIGGKVDRMTEKQDKTSAAFAQAKKKKKK